MKQYNNIEDAIIALTKIYGVEIWKETPRFIAILSDFVPNLADAQRRIRVFARSGGMAALLEDVSSHKSYAETLAHICLYAVNATAEDAQRHEIVETVKKLPAALDNFYISSAEPKAVYDAGMNYYRRFPKDKNVPVALLILEEAWRLGSVDALLYISNSYLKGKGVSQNIEKGISYLELAVKEKNTRAIIEMAEYLWKGYGIKRDVSRAVSLLKSVDDPNALYMLSEIYKENREYDKAVKCLIPAAERNHVYAQYDLATAYATGQGAKRNIQEAKKWLHSAASLGHSEARKKLEELGERWD